MNHLLTELSEKVVFFFQNQAEQLKMISLVDLFKQSLYNI